MKKTLLIICSFFIFTNSKAQLISDFENWHNYLGGITSLTVPNGWSGNDSLICFYGVFTNPSGTFVPMVSKEIPGNGATGTALKVTTQLQSAINGFIAGGPMPCVASNAKMNIDVNTGDITFIGGTPFTADPVSATMWIKNNPVNGDSTQITIFAIDDSDGGDSLVSVADTVLGATISTFTQITIPFVALNAGFFTTKLRVSISSSANFIIDTIPAFANLNAGTSLVVDDITIFAPVKTNDYLLLEKIAKVYPTIAEDIIQIDINDDSYKQYTLQIFDVLGNKIKKINISEKKQQIDISTFSKGNYFYRFTKENKILQRGRFCKQ